MNIQDFYLIQSSIFKRLSSRQAFVLVPIKVRAVVSDETILSYMEGIIEAFPEYETGLLYSQWKYSPGTLPLILPTEDTTNPKSYLLQLTDWTIAVNPEVQKLIEDAVVDAYALYMKKKHMQPQVMAKQPSALQSELLSALVVSMHDGTRIYLRKPRERFSWRTIRLRFERYLSSILLKPQGEI